jgi:hypothetical protein
MPTGIALAGHQRPIAPATPGRLDCSLIRTAEQLSPPGLTLTLFIEQHLGVGAGNRFATDVIGDGCNTEAGEIRGPPQEGQI